MNFGDILDQWEQNNNSVCLTFDKDAEEQRRIEREALKKPQSAKKLPIDARIDLHGLTREEALSRLDSFVTNCKRRGLRKILVIHGKGNHSGAVPILPPAVRAFIAGDCRLGTSGHPGAALGGAGATWVIIK